MEGRKAGWMGFLKRFGEEEEEELLPATASSSETTPPDRDRDR